MPKLQLALDAITPEKAIALLTKLNGRVDIVEAGTPFIMEYGMEAVRRIRAAFPTVEILCDGKIMDAGAFETAELLDAGANYVTVLALTDDETIRDCVNEANRRGCFVMADMICVPDIPKRIDELESLGVHIIAVHTGVDQQKLGSTPLDDLRLMKQHAKKAMVAVAGGIREDTLDAYLALAPDIVIVGGGILNATDPAEAARTLYERLHGGSL